MYFLAPCCIKNFRRRRLACKPAGAGEATTSRRCALLCSLEGQYRQPCCLSSGYPGCHSTEPPPGWGLALPSLHGPHMPRSLPTHAEPFSCWRISRYSVRLLCRVEDAETTSESTASAAHMHAQWPRHLALDRAAVSTAAVPTAALQRHDRVALAMSDGGDTSTYRAPGPPSDATTLTIANLTGHLLSVRTPHGYENACRQPDGDAKVPSEPHSTSSTGEAGGQCGGRFDEVGQNVERVHTDDTLQQRGRVLMPIRMSSSSRS